MLQTKNISFKVDDKLLIDNITVDFEAGKLNLIIGPNGAGKSTLIKLLCSTLKPTSGEIFYSNINAEKISIEKLAKTRSVLSQNIELAFPLMLNEVVMMGRYPHFIGRPSSKDELACEEAMQLFNIYDMKGRNYMTLSGGEKQRVQFARVLAQIWYPPEQGNRYLILDEPLTFLDVFYQYDFMKKITALLKNNNIVVIGVVHDLNLAAVFADTILLLDKGKVIAFGNKENVLTHENIKAAYNMESVIYHENNSMRLFFN